MKKSGGASQDSDQGRTFKSEGKKRKLKEAGNKMLKKLTKIAAFLKSNTGRYYKKTKQKSVENKNWRRKVR